MPIWRIGRASVLIAALAACGANDHENSGGSAGSGGTGGGGAKAGSGGQQTGGAAGSTTGGSASGGAAGAPAGGSGGTAGGNGGSGGSGGTPAACALPPKPAGAIDVTTTGATSGDGSDDTGAIQAAVDKAQAGDTVFVPDGTYHIDACPSGVELKSNITFLMAPGAVLQALPNDCQGYAIVKGVSIANVVVAGGTLIGERDVHTGSGGEWGMGLEIDSSSDVKVIGVTAKDTWGDGFYLGGTNNTQIDLCNIKADNVRRNGLSIVAGDGITVRSSSFTNTNGTLPQSGLDIEPDPGFTVKNVTVTDCHFEKNAGNGIQATNVFGTVTNVKFSNITVLTSGGYGVLLESPGQILENSKVDTATWGVVINEPSCTVTGTTVSNAQKDGIGIQGDDAIVSGNTVIDNAHTGILAYGAANAKITGNTIKNSGWHGVSAADDAKNVLIESNVIEASSAEANGSYDNIRIDGSASQNVIAKNICRTGSGANKPAAGVRIAAAACTGNQVKDNDLVGSGTSASFVDKGTGTIAIGNKL